MQPENERITHTLIYRDTKLCNRKSASCMHVLRYLGEALAIRLHDEIWSIHLKLIRATVLQARENPKHDYFLMPTTAILVN
jgi:hypothetical protein